MAILNLLKELFQQEKKNQRDGRWDTGSIVWNEKPALNKPVGWVCLKGGKPGNWRPFGIIQ